MVAKKVIEETVEPKSTTVSTLSKEGEFIEKRITDALKIKFDQLSKELSSKPVVDKYYCHS